MEVVNHSTTNWAPNEDIYPVKRKYGQRSSELTERTQRCSDFSDFAPENLGEIGWAFKDDSTRTHRSTHTQGTASLSCSARYDSDLQFENDELRLALITARAEKVDLETRIGFMSLEIEQLREQLKQKDKLLFAQSAALHIAKRVSLESAKSATGTPGSSAKRPSLLGRIFSAKRLSKRDLLADDEDGDGDSEILISPPSSEAGTPKNRRSMLKRIFSGKGKDLQESPASESVSDDRMKPQEEPEAPVQYVDLKSADSEVPRVTMLGYENPVLKDKRERVHNLDWTQEQPIKEEASIDGDSDMNSVYEPQPMQDDDEEEADQLLDSMREPTIDTVVSAKKEQEPFNFVDWYREVPVPVLNVKWERVPRKLSTVQEDEEPVHFVDWYREVPVPVLDVNLERIPSASHAGC